MIFKKIKHWSSKRSLHTKEIMHGAMSAFVLKIIAAAVAFGYNILLARMLGAEGSGIYFLSLTIVFIGATIGRLGLDNTVLRYVSIASGKENFSELHGVYQKAILITTSLSIAITGIIEILSRWISENLFSSPDLTIPLQIMALSITPIALFTIHAGALQGLKQIKEYVTILSLWNPLFALIGLLIFAPIWGINGAVLAYMIGSFFTLIISYIQWKKATLKLRSDSANFDMRKVLESCMPLFVSSLLRLIIERSSIIILGAFIASKDVGIFSVAYRMAMLTSLFLVAANSVSAPLFATLYEQGRMAELEHTAKTTAKILLIVATPVLIIFMLFSDFLMGIFGSEFIEGGAVLSTLAIGQFFNLITGSVGYLLVMSGHEKLMRNNLIFSAILCLTLNVLLIPHYGILGAAISTAITVASQNLIATYLVRQKLGFFVIPFTYKSRQTS